jgi:hypothetical protein
MSLSDNSLEHFFSQEERQTETRGKHTEVVVTPHTFIFVRVTLLVHVEPDKSLIHVFVKTFPCSSSNAIFFVLFL